MNKITISSALYDFLNNNKSIILIILTLLVIYRLVTNFTNLRYFGRPGKPSVNSTKLKIRSKK